MKILDSETKFAHLGKPGSVFSHGFQRRLDMLTKKVDLNNAKILDMGCGEGVWLAKFLEFTSPENVYGSEYDPEQVKHITANPPKSEHGVQILPKNIINSPGEYLAFPDEFFDIVFHNEVLEHVQDDLKTLQECIRVLKPGGKLIFFTPNRGWPFETHGMFLNGKYYWGNIPFLPWFPESLYKKFAPHVRNYSNSQIRKLIKKSGGRIISHTHIFPGFDGAVKRFGILGKLLQKIFFLFEKTPLHWFGISHFVVAEK
jgi:SAM-dependent methyltransferase